MNIITFLSGKKSYILAVLGVIYAVSGYILGNLDSKSALEIVWASLSVSALRSGISKVK